MGMFEQFPYTNFHSVNLDWIIDQIKNTIDNAVLSVNGQTGEVILYQSENVVFPDVESDQWRMVRTADGHTAGVLFNQDYMYVMYDNTADRVYTMNHPPAYPVTSVDGQTGDVKVFPNAATRLPDVTDDYTNIRRQIETGGTQNIVGIELKQNKAYRMKDQYRYEMYDSDNPPPYPVTSVNGQTGVVMLAIPFTDVTVDDVMFVNPVAGHEWGIGRETADGTATIQIVTDTTKAEVYIDFFDEGGTTYTKKLLTADDIPSSSGVVSLNGQTGVVTIYGDTMPIESGSPDSVKDITDALITADGVLKSDIAIVEDTDNATHNITSGQYVVWKGSLYTASSNISIGDGLSGSNLSAVSNGGLNDLASGLFATVNAFIPARSGDVISGGYIKLGKAVIVSFKITLASNVSANTAIVANSPYANISGNISLSGFADAYGKRGNLFILRDYEGTLITNTDMEAGTYIFSGCYISNS